MPKPVVALKDFMGRDLHLDDIVLSTWGDAAGIHRMKVIGFTAKQIRLELLDEVQDRYYGVPRTRKAGEVITRYPASVALVKSQDGRPFAY